MSRERKERASSPWKARLERGAWVGLVLALLLVAFVRVRVREMPLERDEGEYAYAGQLLLQSVPPYQLAYNMKLPGTYIVYAIIMAVFGQTASGIHLGLTLVNLAAMVLIFLLGRRLLDSVAGAVAALSYGLLSTSTALQGVCGHATHFVVLFALGGLLLLMRACESNRPRAFLISGLLFGAAFLMKQPGGTFGVFALGYVLWRNWSDGKMDWPRVMQQGGALLAGLLTPLVLMCLWLWQAGVFKAFLFWTIGYARTYVSVIPWSQLRDSLAFAGSYTLLPTLLFWLLGAAGTLIMWWEPRLSGKRLFILGWIIASILATGAGLYFRPHYFITFAPVLALMCGVAVSRAAQQLLHERSVELFTALGTQLGFIGALIACLVTNGEAWFSQSPAELCNRMVGSSIFSESIVVADHIRANAAPGARLAVIGSEPQIYFLSQRRSATGHIYMYGLMGVHPFARKMQDEMIREIEATKPEWIVYVQDPISWLEQPDSDRHLLAWWENYWAANYDLVRRVGIVAAMPKAKLGPGQIADAAQAPSTGAFLILKRKLSPAH